jgi:hypothetical protein
MQRMQELQPDTFIDLEGCTVDKEDELTFQLTSGKKQYNFKFHPAQVKDEWVEAIRATSKEKDRG